MKRTTTQKKPRGNSGLRESDSERTDRRSLLQLLILLRDGRHHHLPEHDATLRGVLKQLQRDIAVEVLGRTGGRGTSGCLFRYPKIGAIHRDHRSATKTSTTHHDKWPSMLARPFPVPLTPPRIALYPRVSPSCGGLSKSQGATP